MSIKQVLRCGASSSSSGSEEGPSCQWQAPYWQVGHIFVLLAEPVTSVFWGKLGQDEKKVKVDEQENFETFAHFSVY